MGGGVSDLGAYLQDGERWVVVASKGGSDTAPAWLHNIRAKPEVEVQVARRKVPATARVLKHDETHRWCLDCHEAPERQIRPKDQIFSMKWEPPPDQLEHGRKLIKEYEISTDRLQQLRDCGMCHR